RRSDMVVCISAATEHDLLYYYPEARGRTAVVHEASALLAQPSLSADFPQTRYALMVANIEPTKNVRLFLRALRLLLEAGKDYSFILVGRDRSGEVARFQAEYPGVRLFHLTGAPDGDLAALYKNALCYINTSLSEGFCLPIAEAQAFGTPVICSDISVLREVAGDGALYIDPHDATTLKDAIVSLFEDSTLAQTLGQRALNNSRRFSWERAARETLAVCAEAVTRRKTAQRSA